MKKGTLLALVCCTALSNAYAVGNGFYLGLMLGPATNGGSEQPVQVDNPLFLQTTPGSPRSNQFGTRFFMGNKFHEYFAFEGGVTLFTSITYDTKGVEPCTEPSVRVRTIDFVGKGSYPFGESFEIFGKLGAGVTYITTSGSLNPDFNAANGTTCGKTANKTKFTPVLGIGASYNINQNWVADASITRIQVGGIVKNVDFYALGISYHFVDRYCGQFLCDD